MQAMTTTFPVQFEVAEPEDRNRVTVLLRVFLMIPHVIVMNLYGIAASVMVVVHWLVIVFTGKRNRGMFDFVNGYLTYNTRTTAYGALLHDQFPAFGPSDPQSPVTYSVVYTEAANRLTVALRILFAIPAMFILMFYGIAAYFCVIAIWFVSVFTGKHPHGAWEFARKFSKLSAAFSAYYFLQHDENPMPGRVGIS